MSQWGDDLNPAPCTGLATVGALPLAGSAVARRLGDIDIDFLARAWDELPVDAFLPGVDHYRFRRYARLVAEPTDTGRYVISRGSVEPFQQSADLIPLYAGKPRTFAEAPASVLDANALRALLALDLELVSEAQGRRDAWTLGLHFIRVVASSAGARAPAPEGRHSDGHDYVAMHLLRRLDCTGGESRVYRDLETDPVVVTTMRERLDSLIIDDRRMQHEVTPIVSPRDTGVRDMLLVDFDGSRPVKPTDPRS